jgi:methyl-accepting chemotaxis protein
MTKATLNNLTLQQKILFPILGAFALIAILGSWYFVSHQTEENESWYKEELKTLAVASGYMEHTIADEFMQTKGLRFHRIFISGGSSLSGKNEIESKAAEAFIRKPDLQSFTEIVTVGDSLYLAVFAPVSMKPECRMCHASTQSNSLEGYREGNTIAVFGSSGSLTELRSKKNKTTIFAFFITIAGIALLGRIVHRTIKVVLLDPMSELKYQTEIVASCDLRKVKTPLLERKLTSNDEMGYVTRSFATMIKMLRATIGHLSKASFEVTRASMLISSSMEKIASGALEQTSQAEEVSAAMEEMTKTIVENSKNASETAETARKARQTAETGGSIVTATAAGMKRIFQATTKSAETAYALEKSSRKIEEVVKTIKDIADQTNLLALNAATEAARVGEKGRGFAIVAEEVRKLAERTMKATKEIDEVVKLIQQGTKEAVNSLDDGILEVNEGMKMSEQAGYALLEIVGTSKRVTDMITQIAASSEEQSSTSEEISKNIEMINSVTKHMASESREVASAAEGLNHLTEQLQTMVNEFKLDEDNSINGNQPIKDPLSMNLFESRRTVKKIKN